MSGLGTRVLPQPGDMFVFWTLGAWDSDTGVQASQAPLVGISLQGQSTGWLVFSMWNFNLLF